MERNDVEYGFFVTSRRNSGEIGSEFHYHLKKQSQLADRWPEIRSTNVETRNKDALQSTFEKTKPICQGPN
jgi:hypothetical protein